MSLEFFARHSNAISSTCLALGLVASAYLIPNAIARPAPPSRTPGTAPSAPPHILPFADHLGLRAQGPLPRRASTPVPVQLDGCDHTYGTPNQCVPWAFPPGIANTTPAKCAWLNAHGLRDLPVHGTDRHHLDPRHRGLACAR